MKDADPLRAKQEAEIKDTLARIKNKLLVMSGKGGVGKSCVSVSLAAGLADRGFRVGLLDVDLHGPSIPQMLGLPKGLACSVDKILPVSYSPNLAVVSIESLLETADTPVIWRGPRKYGAIRQFIGEVEWGELDYLIIDSPPGTGDEPLTVAQTIPDAQAVIVTTPQKVSLRDVRKSINFCKEVNLRILGLIENMSGLVCPYCSAKINLFDTGGGQKAAQEMGILFLGRIPIIPAVVMHCDNGVPAIKVSMGLQDAFEPILDAVTGKKGGKNAGKTTN